MQARVTKQRKKWGTIGQNQEKKQIVGTNVHQILKLSDTVYEVTVLYLNKENTYLKISAGNTKL